MIKTPTVFVLGAGANVPYGFSTGGGLLDKVRGVNVGHLMGNAGQQVTEAACRDFELAVADNMLPSIDALLEHRQDLWPVGKRVMATLLLRQEASAKPPVSDDDWMALVFEKMAEDADSLAAFGNNTVMFITFNYDRYLEYRLIRALVARYKANERDAWNCLAAMKFVHLYGSLGALPEQVAPANAPTAIPLGAADRDGIYSLAIALQQIESSLRIVHDPTGVAPLAAFTAAQAYFAQAKQIFFLGFGFGKTNVARLGTAGITGAMRVFCTAFDMTDREIEYLIKPAFPNFPNLTRIEYRQVAAAPIRRFLRDRIDFLS
jgi:hypothetical protein